MIGKVKGFKSFKLLVLMDINAGILVKDVDCPDVSEILLKRGKRVCTSGDVRAIVGGRYLPWLSRLINTHWLVPIRGFRGVYYVRDPEEKIRSFLKLDSFSVLILVLNTAFGRSWYFGRTSALSISGLIHQPVSTYYVFNERANKKVDSPIFGKVVLSKTVAKLNGPPNCGIIARKYAGVPYNVCSPERNIADCLFLYVHGHADMSQVKNLLGYEGNERKTKSIVSSCYPARSAKKMLAALGTI